MKAKILTAIPIEIEGEPEEIIKAAIAIAYKVWKSDKQDLAGPPAKVEPIINKAVRKKKPADTKAKKRQRKNWSKQEIANLIAAYKAMKTFPEMAKITGHPEKGVRAKVVKLINDGELTK